MTYNMKIVIIDKIGLPYDGNTLQHQGLGGSEAAVIHISRELAALGFNVTVFNNCPTPGYYDKVLYLNNSEAESHSEIYDIAIVSRTVLPFIQGYPFVQTAKKRIVWLHDTFIEGETILEELIINGTIDHIFTLSDWHTSYILNSEHGPRRNYEVLKRHVFQTRNGMYPYITNHTKDPNHFVYNASATKGMVPLVTKIWPRIKEQLPDARLTIIGGFYIFDENRLDDQAKLVYDYMKNPEFKKLDITFTGVITGQEVANIVSNAYMMLYPSAFPETFGISSLESIYYQTPIVTNRFGALEETAIDTACYLIDYAITPNSLFPAINEDHQIEKYLEIFFSAYNNPYLHQQKQQYCKVIRDVATWDTVALQWKQFFYKIMGEFLPVDEYRKVKLINQKVNRIFNRITSTQDEYVSFGEQKRIVVVSPFRNSQDYIDKCIKSVASQDYDNYIHVLIDDASEDLSQHVIDLTMNSLPDSVKQRIIVVKNKERQGAIKNQLDAIEEYVWDENIVMFLDGDDWLVNNNSIFHLYNQLYHDGYEFTYGSMHSLADNIPLIAQEYTEDVKINKTYRQHHFNWKIPYTHLRTCLGIGARNLAHESFMVDGKYMMAGADNPMFYELIEKVDPEKIYCNQEVVCVYNDLNPNNDYKVHSDEQTRNSERSYAMKKILLAVPMNKYIEVETFKSIYDLNVPTGYDVDFQYFFGYSIDQIRNLAASWIVNNSDYSHLFFVDSDMKFEPDTLQKLLDTLDFTESQIASGIYRQRHDRNITLEAYLENSQGGVSNIPLANIPWNGKNIKVDAVGMGCCLIKADLIRSMEYPHFYYKSSIDFKDTISEDIFFCAKARQMGASLYVNTSVICDHVGKYYYTLDESITELSKKVKENIEEVGDIPQLPIEFKQYMMNMSINPKVIFDVGSSVLHWYQPAKKIWENARIVCFDANENVGSYYQSQGVPQEDFVPAVLSDTNKKVVFYDDPFNLGGNSYHKERTKHYIDVPGTITTTITLDQAASKLGVYPDLMKLDIQGAEMDVLKGSHKCLEHCQDVILECEEDYNEGSSTLVELSNLLEQYGFGTPVQITPVDYHFTKESSK